MAKTDFSNAFAKFANHEVKTATIKALDGAEVQYRELTMAENDAFTKRLIKDFGKDGKEAEIDFNEANEIKYEKVALMLIEPKMTIEDLKALPASAIDAINEINALGEMNASVDKEGNSDN
jgi:hypothetical protein